MSKMYHNIRRVRGQGIAAAMLPLCLALVACGGSISNAKSTAVPTSTVTESAVGSTACALKYGLIVGKDGGVVAPPNTPSAQVQEILQRCGVKLPPKEPQLKQKATASKGKPVQDRTARFASCVRKNRGAIPAPVGKLGTIAVKSKTARVMNAVRVCQHLLG